jgi:hypothetical protein
MEETGKRTYCPIELRDPIVKLEESHLCAHPPYQATQLQHQRAYRNGLLSKYMSSVTSTSYLKHGLTCGIDWEDGRSGPGFATLYSSIENNYGTGEPVSILPLIK